MRPLSYDLQTLGSCMKLKPDDYAAIRAAVLDYIGSFPGSDSLYKQRGLSPMRFRWDLLRAAGVHLGSRTACSTPGTIRVYDYANGTRRILRESGHDWASRP